MGYTMLLLFVFLNLTLGGSNMYTITIFKAKKISVYCMGNTFSKRYKHTERHMRQRRLKFSYFHVPLTPSVYITGSLWVYEFGRFYGTSVPALPRVAPPTPSRKGMAF